MPRPRSKLFPIGLSLMVVGLIAPWPVEQAARFIESANPESGLAMILGGALLVGTDVLRLLFFAGIACAIIGWLRNRRTSGRRGSDPGGT